MKTPLVEFARLNSGWAVIHLEGRKRGSVVETRSRYGNLCGFGSRDDAALAFAFDANKGLLKGDTK